jgi:hypothetical protein
VSKKGQRLLVPAIEIEGGWTRLTEPMADVIELYKHHGTQEQFHSEIKTDLDLERLPSGKFTTVLQEVMYRAAKFVEHARRRVLDFGRGVTAFAAVQMRWCAVASPCPRLRCRSRSVETISLRRKDDVRTEAGK